MTAAEPLPVVERTGVSLLDPRSVPAALDALASLTGPPSLAPLAHPDVGDAAVSLVHLVPAGSVTLAAVIDTGRLEVPHAVTVGVAVGTALQALHDADLAHGGVGVGQVLVAPDGSVVLAGTGLAWRAAPGEPDGPRAADDVAALGTLLRGLLGPRSAPAPLVVAALRAVDNDPALRPSAGDLVAAVRRCGDPLPLPLDGSASTPPGPVAPHSTVPHRPSRDRTPTTRSSAAQPPAAAERSRPLRVARGVVVVLLVLTAGAVAVRAVPVGPATAEPAPAAPAPDVSSPAVSTTAAPPAPDVAATDWAGVLAALDEGRRRALESGSEDELALWVDPTGDAWSHDRGLLRRLASTRATLSGGALVLEDVEPQQLGADRVVLAVRDRRTAYEVVQDGRRTRVPERAAQWWTVVLTALPSLEGEGWRVAEVRSATDRAAP